MTTKLISLFALCVLLGTVMLACGGAADNTNTAANSNTTNANSKATTTTTPATTASPAASPASTSTAAAIGVAECDDFIQKYEACINSKVPAAQQATYKPAIEQWRASWKKLADNPATKGTLASVCKTSLDQTKASMASFGCTW